MSKQSKVSNPKNQLQAVLSLHLGGKMNLARIRFIVMFILALCKLQSVCFEKLACGFDTPASRSSSLRRIQRFMAQYVVDRDLIARLIFSLLPHEPPYTLSLDRTNWKFGGVDFNILALAVCYKSVAFPILFTMLPKKGNSSTTERIALIERYTKLFGCERIECLLADREFVGHQWIGYLNSMRIKYHIRIRNNFYVVDPRNGKTIPAFHLFNSVPIGEVRFFRRIFLLRGQYCYLSGSKVRDKSGKIEFQILISFNRPEIAHQKYKERWQIETAFKSLKSSGFNIEKSHLTDIERFEKLLSLVLIAFTWCYIVGDYLHQNIKPIRLLKHGNSAKSLFKHGLETILDCLLNAYYIPKINIFKILSCT
jgi:hypothetical protein